MLYEMFLPAAFILLVILGGVELKRREKKENNNGKAVNGIEELAKDAAKMLAAFSEKSEEKSKTKGIQNTYETVENAVRNCCTGSKSSRDIVKAVIGDWLRYERRLSPEETEAFFSEGASPWVKFETILYTADKEENEKGFGKLWNGGLKDGDGSNGKIEDYLNSEFEDIKERLTYEDRFGIITNLVYAKSIGLGVVDSVMWQKGCIEEIQIGLSGTAKENYDYREMMRDEEEESGAKKNFSRDSVHIMAEGITVRLPFLRFGTDAEMIRVMRNLIKNTGAAELTQNNPRIVCDTEDGRRVTVSRPPFSDSWAALIRKFDAVSLTSLDMLVPDKELSGFLRQTIKHSRSIAVTGETASGKTTFMRAILLELGKEKSIREIESESFELNLREYLPGANILTLKANGREELSDILGFSKKTTGQVFAVGEVNEPYMAVLLTDIAKTTEITVFTAHYRKTEDMVADFTNARLNFGGYNDERLARSEALNALQTDIHLRRKNGRRYIERISEVREDGSIECIWQVQEPDKKVSV